MIIYPENWQEIGQSIKLIKIENTILEILSEIDCNCLSFSGGIDSSLMLWFMLKVNKNVKAFTIGLSQDHPDVVYAKEIAKSFGLIDHVIHIPSSREIENERREDDFKGDVAVRLFYKFVEKHTDNIVACDGIDEFMCGYYAHQQSQNEETYYNYLERLQKEQLVPLNQNSKSVKVYLPYIDNRLIYLLSQISINRKVNNENRKLLMMEMAVEKLSCEIIKRRKYGFCDALHIKG